jgi:GntR family transcriptional regulator
VLSRESESPFMTEGKVLSRESATPLYQQIERYLLDEIANGTLVAHSRLPSERELVKKWGVSRITARQALNDLVLKGYLYTAPGKGFFVADKHEQPNEFAALLSFSAGARERKQVPSSRVLSARIIQPSPSLMQQLSTSGDVVELVRLRYLDNAPVGIQYNWLPHALCPDILSLDFTSASLYSELRERYGCVLASARMTISARLANPEERDLLELPDPGVILTVDQATFNAEHQPVEVSLGLFHPQRYPLSVIQGN